MRRGRPLAWLMLAVWASWLSAAQGLAVARSPLGPWTPDLGLLLLVACAGRLHPRDVPLATVLVALGRVAHTVVPPCAVLAAFLALSLVCQWVRRLAEIGGPLLRTALPGVGALLVGLWFALVHGLRTSADAGDALAASVGPVLATAFSTALFGLVLLGALVRLPGLTPLRERRW